MGVGEGERREREARERRERKTERRSYEPLALHAPPYTGLYGWARSSRLTAGSANGQDDRRNDLTPVRRACRGASLIRNCPPPRNIVGPHAQAF